ncbi:hypothetical protein [Desulfobaculum bizertense]|uniref:Uncharacterized protein n=1 Tax=Desulfobaculum bizertense DSM 18034 TaxID=1121442 RepID=A0A1T4X0F7_9BACT|nr:hypothetical protein [Desulfobaculum bizertense]SKA82351.1 hypothetical protein SAMN02745702_02791 [Desulfobaculum bizertense DSM 18034]
MIKKLLEKIKINPSLIYELSLFWIFVCIGIGLSSSFFTFLKSSQTTAQDIQFLALGAFHFNSLHPRLYFYIISCFFIGLSLLTSKLLIKYKYSFKYPLFETIIIVSFLSLGSCFVHSIWSGLIPFTFFILLFFSFKKNTNEDITLTCAEYLKQINLTQKNKRVMILISVLILTASLGVTLKIYSKLLWKEPVIILNTFQRIPEMYKIGYDENERFLDLSKKEPTFDIPDTTINTTELINKLHLHGIRKKIDIFNHHKWNSFPSSIDVPPNNKALNEFVQNYNKKTIPKRSIWEVTTRLAVFPPQLFYKDDKFIVVWAEGFNSGNNKAYAMNMNLLERLSEFKTLTTPYKSQKTPLDRLRQRYRQKRSLEFKQLRKAQLSKTSKQLASKYDEIPSEGLAQEFLRNANFEITAQALRGGELAHQLYHFLPMFEYQNGKPLQRMTHEYGVGFTVLGSKIVSLFSPTHKFNWGVACRMMPSIALLSFCITIISLLILFKDIKIVSICSIYWIICKITTGFGIFIVYRGLEELRVLFFAPLLCSIYYWKRYPILAHVITLIFLALSLLINFEFGLMLSIAWCGVLITLTLSGEYRIQKSLIGLALTSLLILIIYPISRIGEHTISNYYLQGLLSIPMKPWKSYFLYFIFTIDIFIFIHMRKNKSKLTPPLLFSIFVSMEIGLYYTWSGIKTHFLMYIFIHSIPLIIYFYFILNEKNKKDWVQTACYGLILVLLFSLGIEKYENYKMGKERYYRNVHSHVLYTWKSWETNFVSTMNPQFFVKPIQLIKKYTPKKQKRIYTISQYDFFLTYLSKKNGAYPFFSLIDFLITQKEVKFVTEQLLKEKPQFIFVDSDIDSPYQLDIIPLYNGYTSNPWLRAETQFKPSTFEAMRSIFNSIRSSYTLVESTPLISVYKRKKGD